RTASSEGADSNRGESRLQAFLRAGLQSLGGNGQGEANGGERNLSLKALDGESLMGRQGSLVGTSPGTSTSSEAGRGGDTAAQRVAAMGLGSQAGSGGGLGSGFGGGFGASTGGFGSTFAGTSTAGTIANSPLGASVNGQGWNQAVGERVVFMARNGIQRADVRLHPQNLGPLDIRVSVQNDQASVTFNAQNATTREAVEQALPRLRELFEQQGMDLVDVDVSDQQQQFAEEGERRPGAGDHPGLGEVAADEEADGSVVSMTPDEVAARGGVDYYA
ncbi:MAG: flagellar hook-length control protein FliK, partial [Pseudomonadota bacterium]